jgi:murein DD-endopeptidase MepM/ murein hydrolase activator NlpD
VSLRGFFALILVLGAGAAGVVAWSRFESDAPSVSAPNEIVVGAAGRDVAVSLRDEGMGLKQIRARLIHAKGESEISAETLQGSWFSGGPETEREFQIHLDPKALGLADGSARLAIDAWDWSWRGNQTSVEVPIEIDRVPPRIAVLSGLTYIDQGGAAAVVYQITDQTERDGVEVVGANGTFFYRGYPYPAPPPPADGAVAEAAPVAGQRIAIFAVERDAGKDASIAVVADDRAGNTGKARWNLVLRPRVFPQGNVTLPASFLRDVVPALAQQGEIDPSDPAAAFHRINTEMRRANEKTIRAKLAESSERPLFSGAFAQLANSKVTSRFAEARVYFVDGQEVSNATHYGYDLASLAGAQITAANAGRVMHAGDLGIYGGCVLVDHGLGIASLYGHLSRIDVREGDAVEKDQRLGLSGATGLAGGDHLHFAMLVGPTYADPVEWWDAKWVREHVDAALGR